jgi:chromosome segregation protein
VTAIEAALGSQLQLVLAGEPEAARGIIAELVAGKKGRASIAALSLLAAVDGPAPVSPFEGAVHALSVVEADPSVRPLLQRLLGQTLITPDLATATELFQKEPGVWDFVTTQGDLLSRNGIYTGGVSNGSGKAPASILGRKNQIAELHAAVQAYQEQVGELSRQKGALQSEQTELQASIQQAQTDLRAQEVAIATRQGELRALQQSHRVLEQKAETVEYELETLGARDQESVRQREALGAQIGELEAREGEMQAAVVDFTERLETIRHRRETANTAVTEVKVALASEEQLHQSFQNQRRPLENRIRELAHLAAQRKTEIVGFLARKEQTEADIAASRQKVESLASEREVVGAQTAEVNRQKETVEAELQDREAGLRGERTRLADLRQRLATIEIELAQKTMAVQNLRERIQQKYQVNLDEIRSECITITVADEGPPRITTLTPEEMAASGVATDWTTVAEQVASLQRKLDEMGPVNLVAIDEYEETEQRHQFLTTQHDDLVKAKEQLLEVINRINAQTKEMFTETFNKIRANFQLMFVEIFGGGKADLVLVNEGDVLESGIDIVARPPGKQLQSITLLSGGEQTMTAVALLFSIYQVKPSPFCVLDELDAPLDESNINRFVRVLQRFLVHSQFVIITHNKRTIAMADVLYGVTMQEHGVSRVVSVKFHKADEEVANRTTTLLVPTPAEGQTVNAVEDATKSTAETIDVTMGK